LAAASLELPLDRVAVNAVLAGAIGQTSLGLM
jgi:hypothetical protein